MQKLKIPLAHFHPPAIVWDIAIVLLLTACAGMAALADASLRTGSESLLLQFLRAAGFLGFAVVAYGSFVEPHLLHVSRKRVRLPIASALRIAAAADFHVGPYKGRAYVERVVERINGLSPDVIFLPGDFVEDSHADLRDLEPLGVLRAPLGVYAVLGNHDAGEMLSLTNNEHFQIGNNIDRLASQLASLGIRLLRNEHVMIEHGGRQIAIAGIDDPWMPSSSLPRALEGLTPDTPTILLAHNPDVILDPAHRKAHLIVAGHTHGGQFCLPGIGPIVPIPNRVGRRYAHGIFRLTGASDSSAHGSHETILVVTRGVGESLTRACLCCPPEILVLEVVPEGQ